MAHITAAIIGSLRTTFGKYGRIVDGAGGNSTAIYTELGTAIGTPVDEEVRRLDVRIDALASRVASLEGRVVALEAVVAGFGSQLSNIASIANNASAVAANAAKLAAEPKVITNTIIQQVPLAPPKNR